MLGRRYNICNMLHKMVAMAKQKTSSRRQIYKSECNRKRLLAMPLRQRRVYYYTSNQKSKARRAAIANCTDIKRTANLISSDPPETHAYLMVQEKLEENIRDVDKEVWHFSEATSSMALALNFTINIRAEKLPGSSVRAKLLRVESEQIRFLRTSSMLEPSLAVEEEQIKLLLGLMDDSRASLAASKNSGKPFFYFFDVADQATSGCWIPCHNYKLVVASSRSENRPLKATERATLLCQLQKLHANLKKLKALRNRALLLRRQLLRHFKKLPVGGLCGTATGALRESIAGPILGAGCFLLRCTSCNGHSTYEAMYNVISNIRSTYGARKVISLSTMPPVTSNKGQAEWFCESCNSNERARRLQRSANMAVQEACIKAANSIQSNSVNWYNTFPLYAQSLYAGNGVLFDDLLQYRMMDLSYKGQPGGDKLNKLKGGYMMNSAPHPDTRIVNAPDDGSVGVLFLDNSGDDLLIIGTIPSANTGQYSADLRAVSAQEEMIKDEMLRTKNLGKRQSGTGGHFTSGENVLPKSVKGKAREDGNGMVRHVFHKSPGSQAANQEIFYPGGHYPSVYADTLTHRYDCREKREMLASNPQEMRVEVAKMEDRVRSIRVLCAISYKHCNALIAGLLEASDRVNSSNYWKRHYPDISLRDAVLLEYSCSTGEMRNHYVAAAHKDGNKSHVLESMWYANYVGKTKDALLFLPTLATTIKIKPGSVGCHSVLKNTYHIADTTRGVHNFVMLSGPGNFS